MTTTIYRDEGYLLSLDARSGDEIWRYDFDWAHSINPPSYADGNVYVQRGNHLSDSQLWSFNSITGTVNWSSPYRAQWGRYYAPTITDGKIWVNGGDVGGIYGFDQASGEQLFFNDALASSDELTPLYHEGRLYSWAVGFFREHDPVTGEVLQMLEIGWDGGYIHSQHTTAVADNGIAYFQNTTTLTAMDLASFTIKWQTDVAQKGTPAVSDGQVYVVKDAEVQRIDGLAGIYISGFTAPANILSNTQAVLTDDKLIVSSASQVFIIDRFTMMLEHTIDEGGNLSLADDTLYIAGNGKVSAWKVADRDKEQKKAVFSYSTGELVIPMVEVRSLNAFGVDTLSYYTQVTLVRASECSDTTYRVTGAEPVETNNNNSLPRNGGDSMSTYTASNGEVVIPIVDVIESSGAIMTSYESVIMHVAPNCPGLTFSTIQNL